MHPVVHHFMVKKPKGYMPRERLLAIKMLTFNWAKYFHEVKHWCLAGERYCGCWMKETWVENGRLVYMLPLVCWDATHFGAEHSCECFSYKLDVGLKVLQECDEWCLVEATLLTRATCDGEKMLEDVVWNGAIRAAFAEIDNEQREVMTEGVYRCEQDMTLRLWESKEADGM